MYGTAVPNRPASTGTPNLPRQPRAPLNNPNPPHVFGSSSCSTTRRAPSLPIPDLHRVVHRGSDRQGGAGTPRTSPPPAPKQQVPCFQLRPRWLQTIFRAHVRPRPRQEAAPVSQPPRGQKRSAGALLLPSPSAPHLQLLLQHLEEENGAQPELETLCPQQTAPSASPSRRSAPRKGHQQDPALAADSVCWKCETSS